MYTTLFTNPKTIKYSAFVLATAVSFLLVGVGIAYADDADAASAFNQGIQEVLWNVVANVFGWIVGIAGIVMNYAIEEYVVNFGALFAGSGSAGAGVGEAVDRVWVGVRDIFNLTFIFALVYLGFKMILNSDDAGTRKWLANIIIAALLVNFSLFITKFIVDVTNVLAIEVFQAFPVNPDGISGTFMQIFGLSGIWDWSKTDLDGGGYMYIFGSAIVFLVTAFVFFSAGIMIMIRFIALNLYMVMSPLMFLGMVLPQFQSVSRKYWSGFLGRAFYAPVFLLLLFFSYMILAALTNFGGGASALPDALNGSGKAAGGSAKGAIESAIVSFILGIGFLVASIQVAGKMSADGANQVMKVGNNLRGRLQRGVQNTALAAPRRVARAGVGGSSNIARRMDNRLIASNSRFAKVGQGALATVGLDARTRDKLIEQGRGAKMGTNYSTADNEKNRLTQQTRANEQSDILDRRQKVIEEREKIRANQRTISDESASEEAKAQAHVALEQAQKTFNNTVAKMSQEELTALDSTTMGTTTTTTKTGINYLLSDPEMAAALSDEQIKGLKSSGAASSAQIKSLGGARNDGVIDRLETSLSNAAADATKLGDEFDNLADTIKKFSNERVVGLGEENLTNTLVAANLTKNQMDALYASGKYDSEQMKEIETARKNGLNQIAQNGALNVPDGRGGYRKAQPAQNDNLGTYAEQVNNFQDNRRKKLLSQSTKESGPLPIDIFTDEKMAPYITPQTLEQRMRDDFVSAKDLEKIQKNIDSHLAGLSGEKRKRAQKLWRTWSNRSTYGAQLGLTEIDSDLKSDSSNPDTSSQNTQTGNPYNKFSDNPAEVQRAYDWEQNNPS